VKLLSSTEGDSQFARLGFAVAFAGGEASVVCGRAVNRQDHPMGNRLMQRILPMTRLLTRVLAGAVIGAATVALYVGIDYVGHTDRRLYFIDYRDAILTLLTLGVLIGAAVGFGWAISSGGRNKDGEDLSTRAPKA
jgi:hypothetical protein